MPDQARANSIHRHGPLLLIAVLALVRLLVLRAMLLVPEEAYYWMYSKHPAMGYLDHPPMVAWLIRIGSFAFGDTELGVRIGFWFLGTISIWLCYRLAADWCGRRAGLTAALLFSIAPLYCATGLLAMPDCPLLFFWLLTLLSITRAVRQESFAWWLVAGASTGAAFLSKYSAVFLIAGTILFLLADPRRRRLLLRPGPWLALAVAIIVASPVIGWNANNNWDSFRFQFARRLEMQQSFKPAHTIEWIGLQSAFLSPLILLVFAYSVVMSIRRFRRDRSGRWCFAACFSVPWLLVCIWQGLFTEVRMNWPLPAYLSVLPVAAESIRLFGLALRRRLSATNWRLFCRRYAVAMLAVDVIALLYVGLNLSILPHPRVLAPWADIGRSVEQAEERLKLTSRCEPFIIADGKYDLASELCFYMRGPNEDDWRDVVPLHAAFGKGLSYNRWHASQDLEGRNAVYVASDLRPAKLAGVRNAFARVETPTAMLSHTVGWSETQKYWVVNCYGFKGLSGLDFSPGSVLAAPPVTRVSALSDRAALR